MLGATDALPPTSWLQDLVARTSGRKELPTGWRDGLAELRQSNAPSKLPVYTLGAPAPRGAALTTLTAPVPPAPAFRTVGLETSSPMEKGTKRLGVTKPPEPSGAAKFPGPQPPS